jgi:CHAT domain-containing protein
MRVSSVILLMLIFFDSKSLSGQCPDRDSLYKRVVLLRSTTTIRYPDQLKELLHYEKQYKYCANVVDSVYTFLILSIGVTYYRMGDYEHAVQYTNQALTIIQAYSTYKAINRGYLNRYYYYLSIYYDSLKMPSRKNEAIDSCIANELRANADYHYALIVLEDHVRDLYEKGDYRLCEERAALGEALIHKYYKYDDSLNHLIFYTYYKANALRAQKRFAEDETFLLNKKKELRNLTDRDYMGVLYSLFGNLYEAKGDYKNAILYFEKAFNYDRLTERKDISAGLLNEIGIIYSEDLRMHTTALQYFKRALQYARSRALAHGKATDSFYVFGSIADVYVRINQFDSAFYYFQKALDGIRPGITEKELFLDIENYVNANTAESVIKLVLDKGNAFVQLYNFNRDTLALIQALSVYKAADRLLNKIKEGQTEIQSKLFWQKDAHILYEHAVEAAYLLNNVHDAFYFIEKSRAVLLNEQLQKQHQISDADLLKQAQVKKRILLLERVRDTTDLGSARYIDLQNELIILKQTLESMDAKREKVNPLFKRLSNDTDFINLADLQNYLEKGQQEFLEIFAGDSAAYSLRVNGKRSAIHKMDRSELDSTVSSFISYVSNPVLLNDRFGEFSKTAAHLYRIIFRDEPVTRDHIIISPDNQIFPFEALITRLDKTGPVYFLQDHPVSYTYSARYLLAKFNPAGSTGTGIFLGVAPVQYSRDFALSALEGSDISLYQIGSYFNNGNNLIKHQATRNAFQRQFSNYSIIQLYTHASDTSAHGEPVIFFSDSALYLSDLIPESKPKTRLIVLSACETGTGKFFQGEGVFSFNRGFASLGIPSSVTNLWSVDNKTTYKLTELFYKYLSKGLSIDVALQKAKLDFIQHASKENRLPYYWAATVLAGKSDAVISGKKYPWKDLIAVISLTAFSFFAWKKWGRA